MLISEDRWGIERQDLLQRCAIQTQVVLSNKVTIQGFSPDALPIIPPQPNLAARAKFFVKKVEAKLSSSKLLYKLYDLTIRPALYGLYRSIRFMYRIAARKHLA